MKKVLIWVPTYEWKLNIELCKFLDNVKLPNWWWVSKAYVIRTPIHMARNMLIEKMLDWWFDNLIMIDDDQYPEDQNCFLNLLQSWEDIVSWLVRLRVKQENLNILRRERYNEEDKNWMWKYVNYTETNERWLFQIDNCWCWLVSLSRNVCKDMYMKYAKEPFESKATIYIKLDDWNWEELWYNKQNVEIKDWKTKLCRRVLSEDFLFFERAVQQWYKVYCHWNARCIHLWEPQQIKV